MTSRSFLLLQGVATPFFSELGKALEQAGFKVLRINYSGGDLLSGRYFSVSQKHINYRGTLKDLPQFYKTVFADHKITDVLLFGDTRPIHQSAIELAKKQNIRLYVYEEGYLRPNWITLDKQGVNANSSLSKDPDWYLDYVANNNVMDRMNVKVGGSLGIRAWHDIRYHFSNLLLHFYFPNYESHRPERALKEYWGWIKRMPMLWFHFNKVAKNQVREVLNGNKPFYLLPLQLDADSQIRIHSPYKSLSEFIQESITSFAKSSPADSLLVIKIHPLDPWFVDFPEVIRQAAAEHGLDQKRIIYLEAGDLIALLKKARGTVVVNSTVGSSALSYGCPVIALGDAIYDIPKLTFQGSLDDFWTQASPPDQTVFNAFRSSIIRLTQLNGCFYYRKGIEFAVEGSLTYFENEKITEADQ